MLLLPYVGGEVYCLSRFARFKAHCLLVRGGR